MQFKKSFRYATVVSTYSGIKLNSVSLMGGDVYEFLTWLTQEDIGGHEICAAADWTRPHIAEQYPSLIPSMTKEFVKSKFVRSDAGIAYEEELAKMPDLEFAPASRPYLAKTLEETLAFLNGTTPEEETGKVLRIEL